MLNGIIYANLLTTPQQIVLPLCISIYDALRIQRPRQSENEESADGSIYDAGFASLQRTIRGSRWRYIPSTCALVLGSYMALGLWSGLTSTYICPLVVGETRSIPLMQWLGAALDSFLAIAAYERAYEPKRLILLPGGHFEAYVEAFDQSSGPACDWFRAHLA